MYIIKSNDTKKRCTNYCKYFLQNSPTHTIFYLLLSIIIIIYQLLGHPTHCLTTFSGSLQPGRYLTFSCSVLMISESFLPLTISSYTHILTVVAKHWSFCAFEPIILAIAEPLGTGQHNNIFNQNASVLLNSSSLRHFKQGQMSVVQHAALQIKSLIT